MTTTTTRGPGATVRSATRRLLRWVRVALSDSPVFLPVVLRLTPRGTSRRITAETQLVVEGFPRSANTFAVAALMVAADLAGSPPAVVASHVHTPSQIVLAVRRRVPTLVVIREPRAAIRSLVVAAPHVRLRTSIEEWIHHYELVWPLRDGFVVGTFEQITTDFAEVMRRIDRRFGTTLPVFEHTPMMLEAVEELILADHARWHPSQPTSMPWPGERTVPGLETLDDDLDDVGLAPLLAAAHAVYERYVARAA